MPDRLTLLPLPTLRGERVILRWRRESDIDDRLRHPIDPDEEDGYGSSWRREWDGRRNHAREHPSNSRAIGCYLACGSARRASAAGPQSTQTAGRTSS